MKLKLFIALLSVILWGCTAIDPVADLSAAVETEPAQFVEPEPDSVVVNAYELDRVVSHHLSSINKSPRLSRSASFENITDEAGNTCAYAVNFGNNQGFMIVSATKKLYPVLAWCESGTFNQDNLPEPIQVWTMNLKDATVNPSHYVEDLEACKIAWKQYEFHNTKQVTASRSDGHGGIPEEDWLYMQPTIMAKNMEWRNNSYEVFNLDELEMMNHPRFNEFNDMVKSSIWMEYEDGYRDVTFIVFKYPTIEEGDYLMKSTWEQRAGYNQSYPLKSEKDRGIIWDHAPAGCGPVALGQIFYYHKYPKTFDWSKMYPSQATQTTSDFLYYIALSANANISFDATGITKEGAIKVLKDFGYNYSEAYYDQDIISKALQSLNSKCPVYVATTLYKDGKMMVNENGEPISHAWVLDGYRTYNYYSEVEVWSCHDKKKFELIYAESMHSLSRCLYHVNWGWTNGEYNGYYNDWKTVGFGDGANSGEAYFILYNIKPK